MAVLEVLANPASAIHQQAAPQRERRRAGNKQGKAKPVSLRALVGALLRTPHQRAAPSPTTAVSAGFSFEGKDWTEQPATDKAGAAMDRRFWLYLKSKAQKDYASDFEGAIDPRPLKWVVRAQVGSNSNCLKRQRDSSGTATLVRFAVIGGKEEDHQTQIA